MEADEKKCPRCAETVKAEARVCKHCGHEFGAGAAAKAEPAAAAKKSGAKKSLLGCLGLVALLVVLLVAFAPSAEKGAGDPAAPAAPALKATAQEIAAAYEANEAAAQQQYGSQPLEVTGVVDAVQLDFSDEPFLVLKGTNMFAGPQAHLTEASQQKASSVSKGQSVTLRCGGASEVVGTPMLKDCELQ